MYLDSVFVLLFGTSVSLAVFWVCFINKIYLLTYLLCMLGCPDTLTTWVVSTNHNTIWCNNKMHRIIILFVYACGNDIQWQLFFQVYFRDSKSSLKSIDHASKSSCRSFFLRLKCECVLKMWVSTHTQDRRAHADAHTHTFWLRNSKGHKLIVFMLRKHIWVVSPFACES